MRLVAVLVLFWGQVAFGEVLLHIALIDGMAITERQVEVLNEYLGRNFSDQKIVNIEIDADLLDRGESEIREQIRKRLSESIRATDKITHFIFSGHGATVDEVTSGTRLKHIGNVFEQGVDQEFREIFDPIKHQFAKDANFVFSACSTFCGSDREIHFRAKALLEYFDVPNGRVYGATEPESETLILDKYNRKLKDFFLGWSLIRVLLPASVMLSGLAVGGEYYSAQEAFELAEAVKRGSLYSATTFSLLYGGMMGFRALGVFISDRLERLNRGKVISFINGKLHLIEATRYVPKNWDDIYQVKSCRAVFQ